MCAPGSFCPSDWAAPSSRRRSLWSTCERDFSFAGLDVILARPSRRDVFANQLPQNIYPCRSQQAVAHAAQHLSPHPTDARLRLTALHSANAPPEPVRHERRRPAVGSDAPRDGFTS